MNDIWKCLHPRTPENTCKVSARQPRGQCRTCYNAGQLRRAKTEAGLARARPPPQDAYTQFVALDAEPLLPANV